MKSFCGNFALVYKSRIYVRRDVFHLAQTLEGRRLWHGTILELYEE